VIAFSVFTFAFGATALFPNLYVQMKERKHWSRSVISGYTIVATMVVVIGVFGYLAYGTFLAQKNISTILDANQYFGIAWPAQVLAGIMIVHIVSAFPVVINPVFLAFERIFENDRTDKFVRFFIRIIIRAVLMSIVIILAIFFPYFLDVMTIISCISVSLSGYILPCIFYWKINEPHIMEVLILIAIIAFGAVGSGVGLYVGINQLIDDIKQNPNPFKGLFSFNFGPKNASAVNSTICYNLTLPANYYYYLNN